MKVIASANRGRGTDEDDIRALIAVADEGELAQARDALEGVEHPEPGLDLLAHLVRVLRR